MEDMGTAAPSQPPRGCITHCAGLADLCLLSLRGARVSKIVSKQPVNDVQCCKNKLSGLQSCRDGRLRVVHLAFLS